VHQGGLRDAILHSAGANADHGVRRTNADKRRAALMLLQDEVWSKWNDTKIAKACAVSHTFVDTVRSSHLATLQDGPRLVERGGTVYPMKPRASSPKAVDPAPTVPAVLADALARQYRWEAEQVRGPSAADGGASNVIPLKRPQQPVYPARWSKAGSAYRPPRQTPVSPADRPS
jgi:hypothetical protein